MLLAAYETLVKRVETQYVDGICGDGVLPPPAVLQNPLFFRRVLHPVSDYVYDYSYPPNTRLLVDGIVDTVIRIASKAVQDEALLIGLIRSVTGYEPYVDIMDIIHNRAQIQKRLSDRLTSLGVDVNSLGPIVLYLLDHLYRKVVGGCTPGRMIVEACSQATPYHVLQELTRDLPLTRGLLKTVTPFLMRGVGETVLADVPLIPVLRSMCLQFYAGPDPVAVEADDYYRPEIECMCGCGRRL